MVNRRAHRMHILLAVTARQSLGLMRGFPEFLDRGGWTVHVVVGEAAPSPYPDRVSLDVVPMQRNPSPVADLVALVRWVRLLLRLRPEVVVAGTPKAGLLGLVAAALCRVPVRVYMLRGLRASTETGLKRRVLLATEWVAARCATRVLSVSESLSREFVEARLVDAGKVTVLGSGSSNGVDLDRPQSAPHAVVQGLHAGVPVIGFVGRVCADKGVDVLVQAWRILQTRGARYHLLLVGPEEETLLDSLFDPQDAELVIRTGAVDDVERWYPLMDVLCLPTKREGFPNVVLEAAAAGVPTVASRVTGCVDAVVDGVTGHLVPRGDADVLADRLGDLLADPAAASAMGRAARERAEKDFDRAVVWARTDVYLRGLTDQAPSNRVKQVS